VAGVLDEFLPEAPHRTRYATRVATGADAAWTAMRSITAHELALTRILMAIRTLSPSRLRPEGDDAERPVLETFLERGFTVLREDEPRTLVLATTGQPWRLRGAQLHAPADAAAFAAYDEPGAVRMAMSFELDAASPGASRLATETRIAPTDADAARTFARYWTLVRPGSDIVRLDVLRAVRQRAERD
jgi:hypothetical protein